MLKKISFKSKNLFFIQKEKHPIFYRKNIIKTIYFYNKTEKNSKKLEKFININRYIDNINMILL